MDETTGENVENQERLAVDADMPQSSVATEVDGPHLHVVGSPLPGGNYGNVPPPPPQGEQKRLPSAPPQQSRALSNQKSVGNQLSTLQRTLNMIRTALPIVQKILPMIDGNIASTVSHFLNPQPPAPPARPQPSINLVPLQEGLAALQTQHKELRDQFVEQNSSLKRVEDQLEMVREATDRNTLEQQELLEDLKAVGSKVNLVALVAIGLLAFSVLVNLLLYMHIQRVLP